MVRAAAKNHAERRRRHRPGALRRRARGRRGRRLRPGPAAAAGRARRSRTPPPTTWPSRPGWAACCADTDRRHRLPGVRRRDLGARRRCCATARTRTSGRRSTSTGDRRPGVAAGRAAARQGDVVQQLRRHRRRAAGGPRPRPSPCVAIIKHANPCGIAVGADIARGAPQGARLRPGLGVRRRHRREPAGHAGRWPSRSAEVFTEVVVAPDFDDDALDVLRAEEEHAAAARARPRRARDADRVPADQRRRAACRPPTGSTPSRGRRPAATTRPLAAGQRRRRGRGDAGRPRVRLAGGAAR